MSRKRFRLPSGQSQVWIEARSSLHPIHTTTTEVDGWIEATVADGRLDLDDAPEGRLEVPVDRLQSGNPLYDRELRNRVNTKRFPTIVGTLGEISAADGDSRYLVAGDLTFHGVTQAVAGPMAIEVTDEGGLLLEGESTFDVREFDIQPPRLLGLRVHPDVLVRVRLCGLPPGLTRE